MDHIYTIQYIRHLMSIHSSMDYDYPKYNNIGNLLHDIVVLPKTAKKYSLEMQKVRSRIFRKHKIGTLFKKHRRLNRRAWNIQQRVMEERYLLEEEERFKNIKLVNPYEIAPLVFFTDRYINGKRNIIPQHYPNFYKIIKLSDFCPKSLEIYDKNIFIWLVKVTRVIQYLPLLPELISTILKKTHDMLLADINRNIYMHKKEFLIFCHDMVVKYANQIKTIRSDPVYRSYDRVLSDSSDDDEEGP